MYLVMRGVPRNLLTVLILALIAGTALHGVRAAAMDFAMLAPMNTGMAMPGCEGCGDDGDRSGSAMAVCAAVCVTPPIAPPSFLPRVAPAAPQPAEPVAEIAPVGLTGPPDLHPPRTIALS